MSDAVTKYAGENCRGCAHWHCFAADDAFFAAARGECRALPPMPDPRATGRVRRGVWPMTRGYDTCGAWRLNPDADGRPRHE